MDELEYLKSQLNNLELGNKDFLISELKDFIKYNYNKKIDNKLVYDLIEFLLYVRNLNDYVKEYISYDSCSNDLGYGLYYPSTLTIEIFLSNILLINKTEYGNLKQKLKKLLYLYRIFSVCFHEVEHANQIKLCRDNNQSIETLILRNSMKYLPNKEFEMLLINKGYNAFELPDLIEKKEEMEYDEKKYYSINPSERLAEIKSAFMCICVFISYFNEYPLLKKEIYNYFYDSLYKGYNQYKNPTEVYIKKYDKMNDLELIKSKINSLTLLEKTSFGLTLNNKEKRIIKEKINYLHK